MLVPAVVADVGAEQFDEADAALDQPPGDEALPPVQLGRAVIDAVETPRRLRLLRDVHQLRHGGLHAEGQFVVADR